SPRSDLDSQPFSSPLFLFFPFPPSATPFCTTVLYRSFGSLLGCISPSRDTLVSPRLDPSVFANRSDDLRSLKSHSTSPINRI
ncbi:hypothetical protein N7455_005263, partial [Penicillium solitum]|uniref:uncharacterized protein n=1 Tax=Penicillium solitum TaxID=60172 RepID=UPI0032C427B0